MTDSNTVDDPTSAAGKLYAYEYFGALMTDNFCLIFDPSSSSCAKEFSFFAFDDWNYDVSGFSRYSYLGLAPIGNLNGPSFVQALNATGSMLNATVSF